MIKPPILTISILGLLSLAPMNVRAQMEHVQGSAEREVARREFNVTSAKKALDDGDKAMDAKTYRPPMTCAPAPWIVLAKRA